jgi:hypothetical protein
MKKITSLTPEQQAQLAVIRDKWIAVGLSTEPVDREAVTAALQKCFHVAGRERPRFVIILDSPLAVCVAIGLLRNEITSDQVLAQVSDQVSDQVLAQVLAQVSDQVLAQVSDQVSAQVSDQVRAQVRAQVLAQVLAQVSDQVSAQVREIALRYWWWDFGQFEAGWLSYYDFCAHLGVDAEKLQGQMELAASAGWSVLFWEWALISARPLRIARDERGRLHSTDGAAVLYPDGFAVHAVHGVRVPADIVEDRPSLTVARIEAEENAEVRRVMVELYGQERFLLDAGAAEIHRDRFGTLYRKELEDDEPLVMVKVTNRTPEPDGSFKDYFLRVPPDIEKAHEAVAWTFGKGALDYAPSIET